jgi:hypothetical protein
MLTTHPEELSSTMEQVVHHLEEKGLEVKPLHVLPPNQEMDPDDDPSSIASIYKTLISALPSRGFNSSEMRSKVQAIHEIAVDVGLANIGVLKPAPVTESSSLSALRRFIDINPSIKLSEAAKFVLEKWGVQPEIEKPQFVVVRKRKRVNLDDQDYIPPRTMSQGNVVESRGDGMQSQGTNDYSAFPMSQPERGKYGVRVLRRKVRRSGF